MDAVKSKNSNLFSSSQEREKLMDKLMENIEKGESINGIQVTISGKKYEVSDGSIESLMNQFGRDKAIG